MRKLIASTVLLLAVAACGEVKNFTDAAVGDDVVELDADTSPDAVPTGAVTVTATHACCTATGVAAGVDVIVVSPDGTVGDAVQTAADGTATVQVTAGDSVTTILHEGTNHYLSTHVAVEPGDHLQTGGNYRVPGVASGTMSVTWTPFDGATFYYVYGPCGYNYVSNTPVTTTTQYSFNSDCGTGPFDVAVVAYGASGISGWKVLANQAYAGGGTLPVGTLQNAGTFAVSLSGIPAEVTYASSQATGRLAGGDDEVFGGNAGGTPAAGVITGSFPWATAGAGTVIENYFSRAGSFQAQASREALPASATAYNRTSVELLPWLGEFAFNAGARAVTWIQSGEQAYDGAAVRATYYRTSALFGGATNYYYWTLVVPPGVTNLAFPDLPTAYAAHDVLPTDTAYGGVVLFDRGDADGYDGLRAIPVWELVVDPYGDSPPLDAPPVRWSGYGNN